MNVYTCLLGQDLVLLTHHPMTTPLLQDEKIIPICAKHLVHNLGLHTGTEKYCFFLLEVI
jgi:hypothetical protein